MASRLASKRFKALGKRDPLLDKQDVQTETFKESGDTESEEKIMEAFETNTFTVKSHKTNLLQTPEKINKSLSGKL